MTKEKVETCGIKNKTTFADESQIINHESKICLVEAGLIRPPLFKDYEPNEVAYLVYKNLNNTLYLEECNNLLNQFL